MAYLEVHILIDKIWLEWICRRQLYRHLLPTYMQRDLLATSNQSLYSLSGKVALVTGSTELHFPLRPTVSQYPSICSKQRNRCRHHPWASLKWRWRRHQLQQQRRRRTVRGQRYREARPQSHRCASRHLQAFRYSLALRDGQRGFRPLGYRRQQCMQRGIQARFWNHGRWFRLYV